MPVLGVRLNRHALAELRVARGLSQSALARAAGCSAAHLCDIENGRRSPSPGLASRLASALRVSLVAILADPDNGGKGKAA